MPCMIAETRVRCRERRHITVCHWCYPDRCHFSGFTFGIMLSSRRTSIYLVGRIQYNDIPQLLYQSHHYCACKLPCALWRNIATPGSIPLSGSKPSEKLLNSNSFGLEMYIEFNPPPPPPPPPPNVIYDI